MVYYLQNNSNNNRVCNQQHSGFCSCCGVDVTRFRYSTVIPSSRSTVVLTMETWQPWVLVPLCTTTMNIHPSNDPTNIFFFLFYQPIHSLARSLQQCFETSITTKRSHSFSTIASLRSLALYLKSHYQLWWLISLYLFSVSNNIRMYIQTRLAEKKKKTRTTTKRQLLLLPTASFRYSRDNIYCIQRSTTCHRMVHTLALYTKLVFFPLSHQRILTRWKPWRISNCSCIYINEPRSLNILPPPSLILFFFFYICM